VKLIILDRDGVINQDSPDYIKSAQEWQPIPGSVEAIARLSRSGYTIAVATNQSGLSRGLFGLDELESMHDKMRSLVAEAGGHIDAVYYCPHLPEEGCNCRKPEPGLYRAIAQEFAADLAGVPIIGDSIRDLQACISVGGEPILVRTGKGRESEDQLRFKSNVSLGHTHVFDNLADVVTHLLTE